MISQPKHTKEQPRKEKQKQFVKSHMMGEIIRVRDLISKKDLYY